MGEQKSGLYSYNKVIARVRSYFRSRTALDEAASDEFCSIIRLSTEFIPEKDYPSVTDNSSLV